MELKELAEKKIEIFTGFIESLKALEQQLSNQLVEKKRIVEDFKDRLEKTKEAQKRQLELEALAAKNEQATSSRLTNAKATEESAKERLKEASEKLKALDRTAELLKKQKADVDASQKEISKRERFVVVEEERLKRIRLRVDKLVEAHKLQDIIN